MGQRFASLQFFLQREHVPISVAFSKYGEPCRNFSFPQITLIETPESVMSGQQAFSFSCYAEILVKHDDNI